MIFQTLAQTRASQALPTIQTRELVRTPASPPDKAPDELTSGWSRPC